MAFKLTYTDGQSSDYDDDTAYAVEHGVLKMGREDGKWTVLVSPSHWAVVELIPSTSNKGDSSDDAEDAESKDDEKSESKGSDAKADSKDDDSKDSDSKDSEKSDDD
ncbi:hypothetical protein MMAD_06210 [Mycolicibacterium madagascariense]|uniref:Uncharacterized protein n=1 Tax=Mycolicibacterium madagascariense TaxID=212765 RepID=A0A7I7X9G4_9MYCO|nr:hypothetical protein [Mycolicibacterium madagascariense]MCV7011822.1 hypothetical protein [Mycolicibacterium madagascariense]BBZ26326.1 hypothetical protein MMAD_06210 [Mycolicibacterium madagascariense]